MGLHRQEVREMRHMGDGSFNGNRGAGYGAPTDAGPAAVSCDLAGNNLPMRVAMPQEATAPLSRRQLASLTCAAGLAIGGALASPWVRRVLAEGASTDAAGVGEEGDNEGASGSGGSLLSTGQLPPAEPDPDGDFGVDANVNMDTIDDYLSIPGVAYRDMRLLKDPADYASIGGDSVLSFAIEGFKVVPYPYIGTLQELPVEGAYEGDRLFDVEWDESGEVASATPRYEQSLLILQDLFPQDAPVVLCCGGGGYASMMKKLLVYLGWDESMLYNAGGVWDYTGYRAIELAHAEEDGTTQYFFWRADVAPIDFSLLTPQA